MATPRLRLRPPLQPSQLRWSSAGLQLRSTPPRLLLAVVAVVLLLRPSCAEEAEGTCTFGEPGCDQELREGPDGGFYTKQAFLDHYGTLAEWAAAEGETPAFFVGHWATSDGTLVSVGRTEITWPSGSKSLIKQESSETASAIIDGSPYAAELLQGGELRWSDGDVWRRVEAAIKMPPTPSPVSPSTMGVGVGEEPERRVAADGVAYTRQEFLDFFGGLAEWDAADPELQKRRAADGAYYSKQEFASFYGGVEEWEAAATQELERRLAADGIFYTQQEFADFFGGLAEWHAATPGRAPERRRADDGSYYTQREFVDFFKGTAEWDRAPEGRMAADGVYYTRQEFVDFFGGTKEWDEAIGKGFVV